MPRACVVPQMAKYRCLSLQVKREPQHLVYSIQIRGGRPRSLDFGLRKTPEDWNDAGFRPPKWGRGEWIQGIPVGDWCQCGKAGWGCGWCGWIGRPDGGAWGAFVGLLPLVAALYFSRSPSRKQQGSLCFCRRLNIDLHYETSSRRGLVLMGALLWIASHAYANVCVYKVPKVRHICGMVVDAQGRAIPGASVTLLKDLTPIDELRSKEDSTFSFGLIHTGKYALRMKFVRFRRQSTRSRLIGQLGLANVRCEWKWLSVEKHASAK